MALGSALSVVFTHRLLSAFQRLSLTCRGLRVELPEGPVSRIPVSMLGVGKVSNLNDSCVKDYLSQEDR